MKKLIFLILCLIVFSKNFTAHYYASSKGIIYQDSPPVHHLYDHSYSAVRPGHQGQWRDPSYYELDPAEWSYSRDVLFKGNIPNDSRYAESSENQKNQNKWPNQKVSPFTYPVYYPLYRYNARGISHKEFMPRGTHEKIQR